MELVRERAQQQYLFLQLNNFGERESPTAIFAMGGRGPNQGKNVCRAENIRQREAKTDFFR